MDWLLNSLMTNTWQWIMASFFAFISWAVKRALNMYRQRIELSRNRTELESKEQGYIKEALVSILRYRINQMLTGIQNRGYMYLDEKLDLADLFQAYTSLGGNSRTHDWYMEVINIYKVRDRIRSDITIPPSKEAIDIIHETTYKQAQEMGQKHQK